MRAPAPVEPEAVDQRGPDAHPDQLGVVAVEQHLAGVRPFGQRYRRSAKRDQLARGREREPGVVGPARACVGDIHESVVHSDAVGLDPVRAERASGNGCQRAVPADLQDRDLVASGVDRQHEASVGGLDRALSGQTRAESRSPHREWRPRQRRQRSARAAAEAGDRVRPGGVVVQIHVAAALRPEPAPGIRGR